MITNLKKMLGYFIIFLHCISIPITIYIIIFVDNFFINFFLLLYFTSIVIQWIIYGNCILSPIENYLLGEKKDNTEKSMITVYFNKYISEKLMTIYLTYLPLVIIILVLIKLYIKKYNMSKLKKLD